VNSIEEKVINKYILLSEEGYSDLECCKNKRIMRNRALKKDIIAEAIEVVVSSNFSLQTINIDNSKAVKGEIESR
jgi:hypothetical protein